MKIKEKAVQFMTALIDAYRDEDSRELGVFSKMEFADDITEDLIAMLIAMNAVVERLTGFDGDLIDFTHMLNKLAVQYVMENQEVSA